MIHIFVFVGFLSRTVCPGPSGLMLGCWKVSDCGLGGRRDFLARKLTYTRNLVPIQL